MARVNPKRTKRYSPRRKFVQPAVGIVKVGDGPTTKEIDAAFKRITDSQKKSGRD